MAPRSEVWVTCRAVIEIPCGPYDLSTSFEQLSKSAELEAREKLNKALGGSRLAAKGMPTVVGYRADLEAALPMKPSPLNELERPHRSVCGSCDHEVPNGSPDQAVHLHSESRSSRETR